MERTLGASMLSPFIGQKLRGLFAVTRKKDLQYLSELIEAGDVAPIIDRTFSLSEAAEAIRYLHGGTARGKVVITL